MQDGLFGVQTAAQLQEKTEKEQEINGR